MGKGYGVCTCGAKLFPVWFEEEEYDERGMRTGRCRRACSHLKCRRCGKKAAVDDSFDGTWYTPSGRP